MSAHSEAVFDQPSGKGRKRGRNVKCGKCLYVSSLESFVCTAGQTPEESAREGERVI